MCFAGFSPLGLRNTRLRLTKQQLENIDVEREAPGKEVPGAFKLEEIEKNITIQSIRLGDAISVISTAQYNAHKIYFHLKDGIHYPLAITVDSYYNNIGLSSRIRGEWDHPQQTKSPVRKGEPIETIVVIHPDHFQVVINDDFVLWYTHKVRFQNIERVTVTGDTIVFRIEHHKYEEDPSDADDTSDTNADE